MGSAQQTVKMIVQNGVAVSASIPDPVIRTRSHSVSTYHPRQGTPGTQYCDYCDKKLTSKTSLILHIRTAHSTDLDGEPNIRSLDKLGRKPMLKLATSSFRSRALSLSSSSSSSSSSSRSSSIISQTGSSIDTELFWNKYRRKAENNFVTNMMRRAAMGRFFFREKKYSSHLDLTTLQH